MPYSTVLNQCLENEAVSDTSSLTPVSSSTGAVCSSPVTSTSIGCPDFEPRSDAASVSGILSGALGNCTRPLTACPTVLLVSSRPVNKVINNVRRCMKMQTKYISKHASVSGRRRACSLKDWPNGGASRRKLKTCVSVWPRLACTCVDLRSLWSRSYLHASQRKFFTVWPHYASQRKLLFTSSTILQRVQNYLTNQKAHYDSSRSIQCRFCILCEELVA